jgi:predicted thioesterase
MGIILISYEFVTVQVPLRHFAPLALGERVEVRVKQAGLNGYMTVSIQSP